MEQTFANTPSAASLFNFASSSSGPGQQTNSFTLSQLPSLQSGTTGVPHTIRLAAALPRHYPSSLGFSQGLQQALGASNSVQHFLSNPSSPDPPASGPTSPPAMATNTRSPLSSAAAAVAALHSSGSAAAAAAARPSTTRRRTTRRHAPPAAAGASVLESPQLSPPDAKPAATVPRRSTRARKRAPAAAKTEDDHEQPAKKRRGNLKKPPPGSVKIEPSDDSNPEDEAVKTASCCICMDEPKPADLASISGCDHLFCFECIEKWAERENTCPLCKVRFAKIDRVNKARKKGGSKNSKRVKQKDQRSDIAPGAALEGLLASFAASANFPPHRVARLIFSGMGGNPFMMPAASAMRSARAAGASAAERANALEDSLFSSDTDDEDDDSFLPANGPSFHDLFRAGGPFAVRGAPGFMAAHRSMSHPSITPHPIHGQPTGPASRSYATNNADFNAGSQATNPLEIEDSDEDSEEVEILQVTRPL